MSNIDKQALRGQSVEGSYYLAECGHCGEMYPSNKLNGGEPLFSGDYGECFCHLCGADDTDIADCGAWGSEGVTAWNYQQKRIEALLDELEAKDKRIADLQNDEVRQRLANAEHQLHMAELAKHNLRASRKTQFRKRKAAEKRIADLEAQEVREEGNQFLVVRHPGRSPVIKYSAGDLEGFLRQLLEHDPMATIDIITHRYYGVGGQWVQDADEYLQMMAAAAGKGE